MYYITVQIRRCTFIRPVTFISADFINYAQKEFFFIPQGDAYAIRGIVMNKISCTIQRIYHPAILSISHTPASLFGNKACIRKQFFQAGYDSFFRLFVYIRNIIMCMFLLDAFAAKPFSFFTNKATRLQCYLAYIVSQFKQIHSLFIFFLPTNVRCGMYLYGLRCRLHLFQ